MPNIKKFDAKDCTVSIDSDAFGSFAITSLGEDMVTGSKDEDSVSAKVGDQGDVVVNVTNNNLGTIKLHVQATSPQIPTLKKMAKVRDIFSVWVNNKSTNEKFGGTKAMFKKPADNEIKAELSDREYEVQVFDYVDD